LALVLISTTFLVYWMQIPPGVFRLGEPLFVNRVLSALSLVLTAGLLHVLILATNALEARRREAEEASGRKTRLLASVSHDMRSPLTTINLLADLIRRTAEDPALAKEVPGLAQNLQANASSLADLVTDVLDTASFESGKVELRESELPLNELLAGQCRSLQPLADAKGLRLEIQGAHPPISLRADRVKLARVLHNLIGNAVKFTASGGVTVSAGRGPGDAVLIRVHDTGAGIANENLERIFGDFAQLPGAHPVGTGGWGLGLPICRRLIGVMGGEISVESEPHRGSIFTVRLPASRVVR
jgi:signal transduction histidine kinase